MARILVADDDASIRDLMALACRMDGHVVLTAYDTPTAIAAYATGRPDLLLLDLSMPGGGGLEVLRQAQFASGRGAVCPVVIVSGFLEPHGDAELRSLGATAFISKPFTLDQLRIAIRAALAGGA